MKNPIWDSYNLPIIRPAIMMTVKNWLVDYGSILISTNNTLASAPICSNLFFIKYTGLFLNLSVLGISWLKNSPDL